MVDYIDLAFFSSYTQRTYDSTTSPTDTQIQLLIDLANEQIDEFTGKSWGKIVGYVEHFDDPNKIELLSKTPVLKVTSVKDVNGNDISYTIVDKDFIRFDKEVELDVTYDYGYETTPTSIKMLATLYTLEKMLQGNSSSDDNTSEIKVGPITIKNNIGLSTIVNLSKDIKRYENKIRRFII